MTCFEPVYWSSLAKVFLNRNALGFNRSRPSPNFELGAGAGKCWARLLLCFWLCLILSPLISWGQPSPFSGQAAFIYHVEGEVTLGRGGWSEPSPVSQHLERGYRLRTEAGRAEVVLAPGLLLGVGKNTELEMVKPHLSDLRVRLISGSTNLHVVGDTYLEALSIHSGEFEVRFGKRGVYRLDTQAGESVQLKVFDGKAVVTANANGSKHKVKKGWSLALAGVDSDPVIEKFDHSQKDSLDAWQAEKVAALQAAEREKNIRGSRDPREDLPKLVGVDR